MKVLIKIIGNVEVKSSAVEVDKNAAITDSQVRHDVIDTSSDDIISEVKGINEKNWNITIVVLEHFSVFLQLATVLLSVSYPRNVIVKKMDCIADVS